MKFGTFTTAATTITNITTATTRSSISVRVIVSHQFILPLKLVIRQLNQDSKNFLTTVLETVGFRVPNRYMRDLTCSISILSLATVAPLGALPRVPIYSVEGLF